MFLRNLLYDIVGFIIPSLNLKRKKFNFLKMQKKHWAEMFNANWNDEFAYEWGNPDNANDFYGNYSLLKDKLQEMINKETVILEIGSFSGKWTQYMLDAKTVICVDIIKESLEYLRNKFNQINNIEYYLTSGNELTGINSDSVDLIFLMDTLTRTEKKNISAYFSEFTRVLKTNGKIYIHLPCIEKEYSLHKGFTNLTIKEIELLCANTSIKIIEIDKNIIKHGVMLYAQKEK